MNRPKQFRDPYLDVSGKVIGFYPREFYVFDNFSAFQVDYDGLRWPTVEHAYQASKFKVSAPTVYEQIKTARSPHDAQKIAQKNQDLQAVDFQDRNLEIMYEICRQKLIQNGYVMEKLKLTGDLDIVEDSP